jgi:hypothetical protein
VEIGDAADHRGAGHHLVAVECKLGEQLRVLGVTLDEAIAGIVVVAAPDRAVLAEVVDTDYLMSRLQQLGDQVSADEAGRARDEDLQSRYAR